MKTPGPPGTSRSRSFLVVGLCAWWPMSRRRAFLVKYVHTFRR